MSLEPLPETNLMLGYILLELPNDQGRHVNLAKEIIAIFKYNDSCQKKKKFMLLAEVSSSGSSSSMGNHKISDDNKETALGF